MGKKSKNPKKATKGKKDKNPFFRAVDDVLANAAPREGLPPRSTTCQHMKAVANMECLDELRNQLKHYLGARILEDENNMGLEPVLCWAVRGLHEYENYQNMLDVIIATAVDYLVQYNCSPENFKSYNLVASLVMVASALDEANKCRGKTKDGKILAGKAWSKIVDLLNKGSKYAINVCGNEIVA